MRRELICGIAAFALVAGCGRTARDGRTGKPAIPAATSYGDVTTPAAEAGAIAASIHSFEHASALLHVAHSGQITSAKLALQRAWSPDVQRYAQRILDDHTSLDRQGEELARYTGLAPALPDSALPELQRSELAELARLQGSLFDREYVTQQVQAHKRILALVSAAQRATRNDNLQAMLSTVVEPRIRAHLTEAESLASRYSAR
ncbi:MAG TPA: DUF4142 domain-containing protein [Gemmatimonadaceae bacterium]|nr:DUF4142 domain-containing protein [Gemmatimonadaceae bacterium]